MKRPERYVFGARKPGSLLQCIGMPDTTYWEYALYGDDPEIEVPELGRVYTLRAHSILPVLGYTGKYITSLRGLHLVEIRNTPRIVMGDPRGEPFFDAKCFSPL